MQTPALAPVLSHLCAEMSANAGVLHGLALE